MTPLADKQVVSVELSCHDEPMGTLHDGQTGGNGEDALAHWVRRGGTPRDLAPDEPIEVLETGTLCLITEGWVVRTRAMSDQRMSTTATYLPGDVIGLDCWAGASASDRVAALTTVRVVCRSGEDLLDDLTGDRELSRAVLRRMAADAEWLREAVCAVGRLSARERLVMFLYQTHGRMVAAGLIAARATSFPLPMTQNQLGDLIGMTSIHVNRMLAELRRDGVLRAIGGTVDIHDQRAFEQIGSVVGR